VQVHERALKVGATAQDVDQSHLGRLCSEASAQRRRPGVRLDADDIVTGGGERDTEVRGDRGPPLARDGARDHDDALATRELREPDVGRQRIRCFARARRRRSAPASECQRPLALQPSRQRPNDWCAKGRRGLRDPVDPGVEHLTRNRKEDADDQSEKDGDDERTTGPGQDRVGVGARWIEHRGADAPPRGGAFAAQPLGDKTSEYPPDLVQNADRLATIP
jgi:hypothetical protein